MPQLHRRELHRRAVLALLAGLALARDAKAERTVFAEDGVAVRGTDVVAYFREGRPIAGRREFTHAWRGATWRFASAENRDAFAAEPERYAPAYGGFCAWAVAQGYTAPIDPRAWRIVEGRLYLNYNAQVQRDWERDIPGNVAKADTNWPRLAITR
ncbi:YHS domain-containing (seleno)protein [Elioraea rosea]|uniref:YHS domain-containing (seleno)protein n=1 Tax=Elioraea rosea TaxID=2492390 RepID=UPI001181D9C1|nr:YHS domain-containing (seleno)protein [Elioraea rosea]